MLKALSAKRAIILMLALIISMMSAVTVSASAPSAPYENGALTPPPPENPDAGKLIRTPAQRTDGGIQPFSFDPSHIYLEDGNNLLSNLHNGSIDMSGATFSTVNAETVGVQLTLQRWNGTSWVNYDTSGYYIANYTAYHAGSKVVPVSTGYYYRIVSLHYVSHLGTYESGVVTGTAGLIN
ncbi:hypothetical protein [Paenibacillus sp. MBLB4367]|uniref:hypothetical protein n=1 Tax=Paenibacillus sp. MBLB4367 TaxID=3384767 RepID=UPI00390832AC